MKKIYVVNGAAHSGFGEATTRAIISQGDKVIGLYTQEDSANATVLSKEFEQNELELLLLPQFDKECIQSVINLIDVELDGFINAHFVFDIENVNLFDYDLSEKLFFANYHAPAMLAIELKKKMKKNSSIVIVTSTESERGSFGGVSYAASKAAMHNLIKSLACNWGKNEKIRVNAVAAGWIGGEMDTDGPFEVSINITPLERLGRADEVANAICFLLSEKASFINAHTLIVDGGYLCVDAIAKFEYEESQKK